jgi:signal transduction histidine kinase
LPTRLPGAVSSSAYRVVQEGLTNILKHAGPVPTTVTIDCRAGSLGIEIRDRGRAEPRGRASPAGHGLLGMRERITSHGGTLNAGPGTGGGFVIQVHIPLTSAPVPVAATGGSSGPECGSSRRDDQRSDDRDATAPNSPIYAALPTNHPTNR